MERIVLRRAEPGPDRNELYRKRQLTAAKPLPFCAGSLCGLMVQPRGSFCYTFVISCTLWNLQLLEYGQFMAGRLIAIRSAGGFCTSYTFEDRKNSTRGLSTQIHWPGCEAPDFESAELAGG